MQIPSAEQLQAMSVAELETVNQSIMAHIKEMRAAQVTINDVMRDKQIVDEIKAKHGVDVQVLKPVGIASQSAVGTPGASK